MAFSRHGNFGKRRRIEPTQGVVSEGGPSESRQFQFKIGEANDIDEQSTAGAGVTAIKDDLQRQEQQNLSSEQLEQLFRRASSQLVQEPTDEQDFFKREASIKAPKTSKIIETPFPPVVSDRPENVDIDIEQLQKLAKQEAGPLVIERYSPSENRIYYPLGNVTLTYNQPMIAVSSLDEQINAEDLGISLTPKIEGRWRWTGTKTVQFEAKHRLPYSTKYTLKVNKSLCVSTVEGKYIGDEKTHIGISIQPSSNLHLTSFLFLLFFRQVR